VKKNSKNNSPDILAFACYLWLRRLPIKKRGGGREYHPRKDKLKVTTSKQGAATGGATTRRGGRGTLK